MPLGLTLLIAATILVFFGVGQRLLDRMRLSDKAAVLFMIAIFIGSLIPDIPLGRDIFINIGGAIVPLILVIYLFAKAGTGIEKLRAGIAAVLSGLGVYLAGRYMPSEPETIMIDPNYVYGIIAGIIAYLFGRSRRSSFIAGVLGVILADLAQGIENILRGIPSRIRLGGAGAVDAVVIAGFLAVMLAEVVGELRERIQGGTAKKSMAYQKGEFMKRSRNENTYSGGDNEDEQNS
ncbi:MAG: DUF1614 domain-containing protein [Clostridiales bacterium]|jgi:uncharacterized membrane protein|nr:DUF1614 domain-containing protein [Clostridiales bacterium]